MKGRHVWHDHAWHSRSTKSGHRELERPKNLLGMGSAPGVVRVQHLTSTLIPVEGHGELGIDATIHLYREQAGGSSDRWAEETRRCQGAE